MIAKTPKGAPSTSESVLQQLAEQRSRAAAAHPGAPGLAKLKSTYTDKLPPMVNPRTGRVHTSYHQAVAATGRSVLVRSEPAEHPDPQRGRAAHPPGLRAGAGYRLLAADYSQIELRIMAHLSGDERCWRPSPRAGHPPGHRRGGLRGRPGAGHRDQRRSAKAINFGLIYGMSAFGLARQLGIERGAAQEYVDLYFERYPGRAGVHGPHPRAGARDRYVETLFGRRLYLTEIDHATRPAAGAERTAINAPMQGTAADIIKRAMIAVDRWLGASARRCA